MDPHRARPSIQSVLTRQAVHRSSLLWDAPLEGSARSTNLSSLRERIHKLLLAPMIQPSSSGTSDLVINLHFDD
ncbi:hypothetical protein CMV_023585 [Castanea mollissima]|uniref:Uncharacterized protein n=1 Tax=Castanea mollissima TaxID=60419 RepID=A0A8J4QSV6_9ROSI|nr:hypothetical protein CMV_023585 [Castanea mollissima]